MKFVFLTLLLFCTSLLAEEPLRTFTAKDYSLSARLISHDGKTVTLENQGGQKFRVNFELLSKADQDYITKIVSEKKIPKKNQETAAPLKSSTQDEKTITVQVTGMGKSIEDARKSAIQKAVRKALGEIVDAETIAKNGELIQDAVITYSDGFVSKTRDLTEPSLDEDLNLYRLTLQAEVIRSKVVKRLKEVNVQVVEVDGNSLFAQALTKMDKAESGKKLLAKVLNEDLDPAKLITCQLVALDAAGKLVRGKEALNSPNTIKPVEGSPGQVELTMSWEVSVDMKSYYQRVLPRLTRAVREVSKRQISKTTKRIMDPNDPWDRNLEYHNYITKSTLMWEDDEAILTYIDGHGVYFGKEEYFKVNLGRNGESKDSPWRLDSQNKSLLIAIELRSNPTRSECDFEIHELDFETFFNVFGKSPSIVFPDFQFSIVDTNKEVILERKISVVQTDFGLKGPSFLLANNENKKISKCLVPFAWIPKGEKDKVIELMGIAKLNSDRVPPYCITISPEFIVELGTKYSDSYGSSHQNILLNDSLIMEVKETLSIDQLKEIRNLFMQPISRTPKQ